MSRNSSRRRNGNSGRAPSKWQRAAVSSGRDISRILDPSPTVEVASDGHWYVQYMPAVNARKNYICPECGRTISPGVAHLVVWQENHLFGKAQAIAERRHWHQRCWQTRRR
ncbi:ATP/GTP-binding protein [Rothia sp. P6271]|uniref:ATP/GTP-binding protein n=1 Tax=unclassified Rothia (in: high G+C Gram-positive bacteria) TaxID=2689056 RepID=UPI003AD2A1AF